MPYRFCAERRNRKEAKDLVVAMARHGNHYLGDFSTRQRIEDYLHTQGYTLDEVAEECRDKGSNVTFFENLIPVGGWSFDAGGAW